MYIVHVKLSNSLNDENPINQHQCQVKGFSSDLNPGPSDY